ncbi:MAG TPA: tetratricopeptide repeat protein [Streptosporangiaceae bacterium]|jgi:putative thioredoxin
MQQQPPQGFSIQGAVDLGARQAVAQRRQRAAPPPGDAGAPGAPGGPVIEVTDETFNTEVVARSRTVPVIVDLWAEWCGPCKQLGPILEKLAAEANGAWILAKVDVDANPQLSAALQVQSIPMVVAVVAGQVADGFLGAMPEPQVRSWVGQVMQVAEQLGLTAEGAPDGGADGQQAGQPGPGDPGPDGPMSDPAFAEAQAAIDRGDLDAAAAAFEKVLADDPGHPVATMELRRVELMRRVSSYDQASARQAAQDDPGDVDAQLRVADIDLAMGKIEASFDRLLEVIGRSAGEDRDKARVHLLGLFEAFPPREPLVTRARGRLSSLLF